MQTDMTRGPITRSILIFALPLMLGNLLQQSIMNFGILMVQGLVNSFGAAVMAAFAATVKIESFAYMPVQDFGNAFSTFVAQNYGAGNASRIRSGIWISVPIGWALADIIGIARYRSLRAREV